MISFFENGLKCFWQNDVYERKNIYLEYQDLLTKNQI